MTVELPLESGSSADVGADEDLAAEVFPLVADKSPPPRLRRGDWRISVEPGCNPHAKMVLYQSSVK